MLLGTTWKAPGEGDDLNTLAKAFGRLPKGFSLKAGEDYPRGDIKTNLALTGEPLYPYDYQRYDSLELRREIHKAGSGFYERAQRVGRYL